MWTLDYKKNKKVVEGRTMYGGANILLTVNRQRTRLAMNGGVFIDHNEFDEFVDGLAKAVKDSRAILETYS